VPIGRCANCNGTIYQGEELQDSFPGIGELSDQTGQPVLVSDPKLKPQHHLVHRGHCAIEYAIENNPDEADEMLSQMVDERAEELLQEYLQNQEEWQQSDQRLKDRVNGDD
jgi:hypothetical protein